MPNEFQSVGSVFAKYEPKMLQLRPYLMAKIRYHWQEWLAFPLCEAYELISIEGGVLKMAAKDGRGRQQDCAIIQTILTKKLGADAPSLSVAIESKPSGPVPGHEDE